MIEERVNYALKNFFNLEKFKYIAGETSYSILEKSKKGKTKLILTYSAQINLADSAINNQCF